MGRRASHLLRMSAAAALTLAAVASGPAALASGPAALAFREVSVDWGLVFRHHHGGSGERYMVETVCGGVALFDYDGDGDVDAFFVDGGALPGYRAEPGEAPRSRLFRNEGGRRFVDVTERAGIAAGGYGCGVAAGDIEGDGDLDLYVSAFGPDRLLENRGDGTFVDATERAGVGDPAWSASSVFADFDLDGDLDLYVANYVAFTVETHKFCGDEEAGLQGYCHPNAYEGLPDRYYRNRGDGTFEDATAAAGLAGAAAAGLGVAAGDLDGDGWPDLYVADDADPNLLFRNRGDGTFEDVSLLSGTAYSETGRPEGGMGVDFGDVDGDGRDDIVVTNFEFEPNALYLNAGQGLFRDGRYPSGLAESSLAMLAFGVDLADLDHDGDLDLAIANGHILDNAAEFNPVSRYAQPNQIYRNLGGGRFAEASGTGLDLVRASRGLATGDLDGDGDLELVIVDSNDLAEVWENVGGAASGGWILVGLSGRPEGGPGNRFGIGARVAVEAGGRRRSSEARTSSSYLSQNDLTLHFGLGALERAERLEVAWPGGRRVRYLDLPGRRRIALAE